MLRQRDVIESFVSGALRIESTNVEFFLLMEKLASFQQERGSGASLINIQNGPKSIPAESSD